MALGGEGRLLERLKRRGVDVHVVPVEGWRYFESRDHALKLLVSAPLQSLRLAKWIRFLRRRKPDLVHLNSNRLVEPILAAWCLRIPIIVHFRDIPSRMTTPFVLGGAAFYGLMNRADRWIANSAATAEDIRPHAKVPIAEIPNGLDVETFDRRAVEKESEVGPRGLHVAMIALINPWKRYEVFLDVAGEVLKRRPDVRFSIVGTGSDNYVRELRAMCVSRGLDRAIAFAGHIDNIPSYLQSVDILVHTTDPEPFGRVFLEAMAARRPVVAFRSGGPAQIVVDGLTGYLVEPGHIEEMASAVLRLLADSALRREFGEAGRHRVEQVFSVERHRERVAQQYEAVLSTP